MKGTEEHANGFDERLSELQERARQECLDLLDSAWFSTRSIRHMSGELMAVSILTRPDKERPDLCRIEVICQCAGHLQVEWNRVPLQLLDLKTSKVLFEGVLGERGRSAITIPFGDAQERRLRFRDPIYVEYELPADALAVFGGPPVKLPSVQASDRLSVVVETVPQLTLRITIRALHPLLLNTTVKVEIRSRQSGAVVHEARVPLEFDNGIEGVWDIRGELLDDFSQDELVLRVRPA